VLADIRKEFRKRLDGIPTSSALILCDYILAVKADLSDSYRKIILNTLCYLSKYHNNKPFKSMTREDILLYLGHFRKQESEDPSHKWIGTYNLCLNVISKFFR
jgi:integrase/recombinase XerD